MFSFSSLPVIDKKFAAQILPYIGFGTFEHFAANINSICFSALLLSIELCAVKVRMQCI